MKKRILSTLLFGALFVASTSTLVSCKDYDDDINSLQSQVDKLADLTATKEQLASEIASLKAQLEAADAKLQAAVDTKADASTVVKLAADVSALEARIATAEQTLKDIQKVLDDKVSKKELQDALDDINAKIAAVNTNLAKEISDREAAVKAVQADLDQQKDALVKLEARVKALEDVMPQIKSDLQKAQQDIVALQKDVDQLKKDVAANTKDIEALKKDMEALSKKVDSLTAQVNVLNVLVKSALRSLVFVPQSYYFGVESMPIFLLDSVKYAMGGTNLYAIAEGQEQKTKTGDAATQVYIVQETVGNVGYDTDIKSHHDLDPASCKKCRYQTSYYNRMLNFWAEYELNPCNAEINVDDLSRYSVISSDKQYITTRTATKADCGLSIDGNFKPYVAAGSYSNDKRNNLFVPMAVENADLIKSVLKHGMITNFALQYQNNVEDSSNVITSDFATLYKDAISFTLAHAATGSRGNIPDYNVENTHCRECNLAKSLGRYGNHHNHLMATIQEATGYENQRNSTKYMPQDSVAWNGTIDLSTLIEIHEQGDDGVETKAWTPEALKQKYNISVKFELASFHNGDNKTDESAHAAINPADGKTLRPQRVTKPLAEDAGNLQGFGGLQQFYGAEQTRQEIGRTPVVRVQLIDDVTGAVLDYGYICLKIVDKVVDTFVPAVGPDYIHKGECDLPWQLKTSWSWTEDRIYREAAGCQSRDEFIAEYGDYPEMLNGDPGDLKQFYWDDATQTFKEATYYYGHVTTIEDMNVTTGEKTSVIVWNIDDTTFDQTRVRDTTYTNRWGEKSTLPELAEDIDGVHKRFNDASDIFWNLKSGKFKNKNTGRAQNPLTVAVRYVSKLTGRYIYVRLSTADASFYRPKAKVSWGEPITNYWYKINGNDGYNFTTFAESEFHVNVYSPEDRKETQAITFADLVSDVFHNNASKNSNNMVLKNYWCTPATGSHNLTDAVAWIDPDLSTDGAYALANWQKLSLVFDEANNGKEYNGYDVNGHAVLNANKEAVLTNGKPTIKVVTYVMVVQNWGKELWAYRKDDATRAKQLVAKIDVLSNDASICSKSACVNEQSVVYQHSDYAESLLNYRAHNELANDVITAFISIDAFNKCLVPIRLQYENMRARFLRPINIVSMDKDIQDAGNTKQVVKLYDLFDYTDWRDAWGRDSRIAANKSKDFTSAQYFNYYNIKRIYVKRVASGDRLSNNDDVLTDLGHAGTFKSLNSVSTQVDFTYNDNGTPSDPSDDYLEYNNLTSTLHDCVFFIPVTVEYEWGEFTTYVKINLKRTLGDN